MKARARTAEQCVLEKAMLDFVCKAAPQFDHAFQMRNVESEAPETRYLPFESNMQA